MIDIPEVNDIPTIREELSREWQKRKREAAWLGIACGFSVLATFAAKYLVQPFQVPLTLELLGASVLSYVYALRCAFKREIK